MATKKQRIFEMIIKGDTSNLEQSMSQAVGMMKTKMAEIDKAADKVTHLKELVDYIAQIDRGLEALHTKDPFAFDQKFAGLDAGLKEAMETLFGSSKSQLTALDTLRTKLENLTPTSTVKDIKVVATEVNELFKLLGKEAPIKLGQMNSGTKVNDIQVLTNALADFANVWEGVNTKLAGGLSGANGAQAEVDKLKAQQQYYQEILDIFHGDYELKIKTNAQTEEEVKTVQKLTDAYRQAERAKAEYAHNTASKEYQLAYADQVRAAILLKNTIDDINDNGTDEGAEFAGLVDNSDIYNAADEFLENDFYSKASKELVQIQNIVNDVVDDIRANLATLSTSQVVPENISGGKQQLENVASGFQSITTEAEKADKAAQKVMYHIGNLLNGKGSSHDTFGDMPYNLTEAALDTKYEQYGFGVLGGGLFGVTDPTSIDHEPGKTSFIQSIDISKYNMYMADTEQRATALIDFLSKLQKFSIKSATPGYTGFDEYLRDVDVNSLYSQFQTVFEQTSLTKDQFNIFIEEMASLLKQSGLVFDQASGALEFTNMTDDVSSSDNISTRFMKMLGYQGVYTGTTSFGGVGQGSVLFDFKKEDIVGYFNNIEAAVQDYQRIMRQADGTEWVGTTEQLKQYANNLDLIIDKIQTYKNSGVLKNDHLGLDETLNKLFQIKQNIDSILSGKVVQGDGAFATITTGAGSGDSVIKETGVDIDQAKLKVQEFLALAEEIRNKDFVQLWSAEDNVEVGKYTERLNAAKQVLDELGRQGLIAADELSTIDDAFNKATSNLDLNTLHYDGYGNDSGGGYDYYDEYVEQRDRVDALQNELEQERKRTSGPGERGSADDSMGGGEVADATTLLQKIQDIRKAIDDKTEAFENEARTVDQVVAKEIQSLSELKSYIEGLKRDINALFDVDIKQSAVGALKPANTEDSVPDNDTTQNTSTSTTEQKDGGTTDGYALNSTLLETNGILTNILHALQNDPGVSSELASSIMAAVTELRTVAGGIITEQKAKQESRKTQKKSKKIYDDDQVRAKAQEQIDNYTAEGKQATVKFADDGKYTITVLEEIDGLAKKVTQTLDETGVKEERVAASISNAQKIKLQNLQALIKAGSAENLVSDSDDIYKQYQKAAGELDSLNAKYQNNNNLSDEEILKWNEQIKLVQQLGASVENLINKRKVATPDNAAPDDVFISKRNKQVGKFNLDEAKLRAEINIPESFNQQIEDARKKMADAVDEQALQIAVNEWDALKNAIKTTATEQDLFVEKSKTVKETGAEKAAKEIAKNNQLRPVQTIMATANEEIKGALGTNFNRKDLTDEQQDIKQLYDNLGKAVEEYKIKVQHSQQVELSGIQEIEQALYEKINAYKTNNHIVDARQSTFGATTTNRLVGTYTGLKNTVEANYANSSVATQKLKEYADAIKHLQEVQANFGVGERDITADQEQEFNTAREACSKYAQELRQLIAASEKAAAGAVKHDPIGADFSDNLEGRKVALKQYVEDTYGATAVIGDFTNANNKLFFTVNNGDGTFSEMAAEINKARNAIDVTSKSTKQATNTFDAFVKTMEDKFKSIGAYLISSFSIQEVWQQLRKGVEYVREIDLALTELKKVTDETDASYERFLNHMSETASVVGSTVKDLTNSAADWARLNI